VPDGRVVPSALANVSSRNAEEIPKAFLAGATHLGTKPDGRQPPPREKSRLEYLDVALDRLAQATPKI
jgi:hypothetical protein